MIRISLLRLTLLVSRAAIAVSSAFKPATWKRIAIALSFCGLSFLLMYGFLVHFSGAIFQTGDSQTATEALTTDMDAKTDDLFNGFGAEDARIEELLNESRSIIAYRNERFENNKFTFSERETIENGLGPIYKETGCVACHVTNEASVEAPARQLIYIPATGSDVIETIPTAETGKPFRVTLSTVGDGFAECLANQTLLNIALGNARRVGRFDWKDQNTSLLSFAGNAYLNELGITKPFDKFSGRSSIAADAATYENLAKSIMNETFQSPSDSFQDLEEDADDVLAFADFMIATRVPAHQNPAIVTRGRKLQHAGVFLFSGKANPYQIGTTVPSLARRHTLNNGAFTRTNVRGSGRFVPAAQYIKLVSFSGERNLNKIGATNSVGGFGGRSSRLVDMAGLKLPKIGFPERHVFVQSVTTDRQTLLETLLKLMALFQGITLTINGSLASVLALIAYHRNKVDLKVKQLELELKRLQILQIQQQLDKHAQERQREIEETTRSSIVLIR